MPGLLGMRVTGEEYRANLTGLNTFFGAVLGFVLADVTTTGLLEFAQMLLVTAGIVISILYVSASPQRWTYAVLTMAMIWWLPRLMPHAANAGRLQVTLAVWTGMTVFVEALWWWQQRRDSRRDPPTA